MNIMRLWLALSLLAVLGAFGQARAEAIQRHGEAFVVYIDGKHSFNEVVEHLKTEILAQNWEILGTQHIDEGMKKYGLRLENKLILACKSQYLARAIEEDPFVTLIIPCRFTVFRESLPDGRIVVGLADPIAEAEAVKLKQYEAAKVATEELKRVLEAVAEAFSE